MNDVSLTGCFLNDLQSPEKSNKNGSLVNMLNENSRDSIFFNVSFFSYVFQNLKF
jgi:hypothetical protein